MTMVEEILKQLIRSGRTVSCAESITAGHLQTMFASISGSSKAFQGGLTAYQPEIKTAHLGVDLAIAEKTNCVDPEIAKQMAFGALQFFGSDYAIATCGYAEPYPEKKVETPVAYIAVADKDSVTVEKVTLFGTRVEAQKAAAVAALKLFHDKFC